MLSEGQSTATMQTNVQVTARLPTLLNEKIVEEGSEKEQGHGEASPRAFHDLAISTCGKEPLLHEDVVAYKEWKESHPDNMLREGLNNIVLLKKWDLESAQTGSELYGLSHMIRSCYGMPTTEPQLQIIIDELEQEKAGASSQTKVTLTEFQESYREKFIFCEGRSFDIGDHISIVKESAQKGDLAALLEWTENYLPRGNDADPAVSLAYARMLEASMDQMTFDRAILLGSLYAEADMAQEGWNQKSFDELIGIKAAMAYFEMARRIMPARRMPEVKGCEIMSELLFQLHTGFSAAEQIEVEAMAKQYYEDWF